MKKVFVIGRGEEPLRKYEVGKGESLSLVLVVLPGVNCDVPLDIEICGEGASVDVFGLYICSSDEKVSLKLNLNHKVGGSVSNQLFKGIVGGTARTDFFGKIIVAQDAQKTEAYQTNHNLLLSDDAKVNTKPQLEIYADDVKCSHGAAVGSLNEVEQFYMCSRGITKKEARALQMQSFISPVTSQIDDETLIEEINNALRNL